MKIDTLLSPDASSYDPLTDKFKDRFRNLHENMVVFPDTIMFGKDHNVEGITKAIQYISGYIVNPYILTKYVYLKPELVMKYDENMRKDSRVLLSHDFC